MVKRSWYVLPTENKTEEKYNIKYLKGYHTEEGENLSVTTQWACYKKLKIIRKQIQAKHQEDISNCDWSEEFFTGGIKTETKQFSVTNVVLWSSHRLEDDL